MGNQPSHGRRDAYNGTTVFRYYSGLQNDRPLFDFLHTQPESSGDRNYHQAPGTVQSHLPAHPSAKHD
ncbi:hypothetical protein BC834DRAFT_884573 [Gloeopeniophorella convolvens]|nr:hypothetical protein BC834DRAFT_884573 [Gloeopeniophorella convolvens]